MAQMKEQNRSTEKRTKRNRDNQPIICRNQTLVIRMLKELIENSNNIKEAMKVTLSEIKKNLQGTINGEEEARIQINDLEYKGEISSQAEQQEGKRL